MDKDDPGYKVKRAVALALYAGFYYCPTTGRVIEALPGDDKALCSCGVPNPAVPTESTHRTGTHVIHFLQAASVDAYIDQRNRESQKH